MLQPQPPLTPQVLAQIRSTRGFSICSRIHSRWGFGSLKRCCRSGLSSLSLVFLRESYTRSHALESTAKSGSYALPLTLGGGDMRFRNNFMRYTFIVLSVFASTAYAPRVFASTDLTPITSSPVTSGSELGGFAIFRGDARGVYDATCGNIAAAYTAGDYIETNGSYQGMSSDLQAIMFAHVGGGFDATPGVYTVYYALNMVSCPGPGFGTSSTGDITNYGVFYWDGTAIDPTFVPDIDQTKTYISSTFPFNGAVVSSTSPITLTATGHILNDDIAHSILGTSLGARISWNFASLAQSIQNCTDVICAFEPAATGYQYYSSPTYDIFGNNDFYRSTTTPVTPPEGDYTLVARIVTPSTILGFQIPGEKVLYSVTSHFTVGTSTELDVLLGVNGEGLAGALGGLSTTTQAELADGCDVSLNFSIGRCFAFLFYPDWSLMATLWDRLRDGFLSAVPWGYATIIIADLNSTATSTLPNLIVDAPTSVMGHAFPIHASLNVNVFAATPLASSSMFSTATSSDNKTFREVTEPYWDIICGIFFALAILHLVMGIDLSQYSTQEYESESETVVGGRRRVVKSIRKSRKIL